MIKYILFFLKNKYIYILNNLYYNLIKFINIIIFILFNY